MADHSNTAREPDLSVSIGQKCEFLSNPANHPDDPAHVERIETHLSWVFLAREFVYKLKKPAWYPFLNLGTIDARHRDCDAELHLNRRLAPDVYLQVVPLLVSSEGSLTLQPGGATRACDWLVKMRRLPARLMLDRMLAQQQLDAAHIHAIAELLADFYVNLEPIEISTLEYRQRFYRTITATREELATPAYLLPERLVTDTSDMQLRFLERNAVLFDECVRQGRVIEGHGDLRPEHICLEEKPCIIDCLQFNRDLRLMDCFDDCAFLALECERLGAPGAGHDLVTATANLIRARNPARGRCDPRLQEYYMSYRAAIRAKLAARHLDEHHRRDPVHWQRQASRYLQLANAHGQAALAGKGA